MLTFDKNYFSIEDTLKCGQTFAFEPYQNGYVVKSADKFAFLYYSGDKVVIESENNAYFENYFDLNRDYQTICQKATNYQIELLTKAVQIGKGIRILKQDPFETIISFLISQNNNISRITKSIFFLCEKLGKKVNFLGERYAFPTPQALANAPLELLKNAGLGYRCNYVLECAKKVVSGEINIKYLQTLSTKELKLELLKIKGVGEKVANCIMLFGFSKFDSFPVDTWIEKVYLQDFNGKSATREKITEYFINLFGDSSGIIQQYLFNYKRNIQGDKKWTFYFYRYFQSIV